jgi:uncharacterized protein (TIGR03435 family)
MALGMLIRMAYGIQDFQVVGGPSWLYDDRFDVLGKRPETATPAANPQQQFNLMMQSLLADRFKLRTHTETRELPIYALVLARRDGKLGPQLRPSTADCTALARGRGDGPPPGAGPAPGGGQPRAGGAGFTMEPGQRPTCGMVGGRGTFMGGGMQLSQLTTRLSQELGRVIVDKTGLTGRFDVDLKYTPEGNPARSDLPPGPPGVGDTRPADPDAPTVFAAVEEQLGLKLEAQRGPVEVLVIDNAETPTEN